MTKPNYAWYKELKKPRFAPPPEVFGVVWSILYAILGFSLLAVIRRVFASSVPAFVMVPFTLNLIFNLAFTPIQFRLKNNLLALVDVLLVVMTLTWALCASAPYYPLVVYANIPYFLWSVFAGVLQASIFQKNRTRSV